MTVEGPRLFWGPSHLLLHEVRSPYFSFIPLLWTLVALIALKTLEVNPRQASVSQAVSKMQSCRGVGVIPSRSESDLLWAHGQSAARLPICCGLSKSGGEDHLRATKSVESADVLVERMLNLDVFSTSHFLPFTGETGFFIKRYWQTSYWNMTW